jgi:hypothetical protein
MATTQTTPWYFFTVANLKQGSKQDESHETTTNDANAAKGYQYLWRVLVFWLCGGVTASKQRYLVD